MLTVLTYAVAVVLYGYLSLTVPALATESKNAPGWIGKPARPTNPVTAFERSVRLIGRRNLVRVGLIYGGLLLVCLAVVGLVGGGVVVMIALYARAVNADVEAVLELGLDDLRRGRLLRCCWRCRRCWPTSPPCRPWSTWTCGCGARAWTWPCGSTASPSPSRPRPPPAYLPPAPATGPPPAPPA